MTKRARDTFKVLKNKSDVQRRKTGEGVEDEDGKEGGLLGP